ncbi:DUF262 domain-containing protein [Granulicella arctica]|uniref:DUF262 domain-containing protein n=1 Tax=Granulicella arctica TaxID=940613 RepID=UPI0021E0AC4D|nr:DUF262 domain-containing protein [Granulicella arctica]
MADNRITDLIAALDSGASKVHTQALDVSFNEILDMYSSNELDISPDYQRLFRWPLGAQSRFIESLLLEMPVPPIYVVEAEEGRYMLIDGLQRISSYLHLRGVLEAPHLKEPIHLGESLTLQDCDIVHALNGLKYEDLGTALQIRLKRAFVRMEVVRKGSDPRFKYYMFKRLNTGGEALTAQQLRNCTIRLLSADFNDFIITLSQSQDYKATTQGLTEEQRLGAFDQELVLRFFAMKNNRPSFKHDIADFLTEYMESVSERTDTPPFDYVGEEKIFVKTFTVLAASLGEEAFAYASKDRTKLTRSFSVLHFEAISLGLQGSLPNLEPTDLAMMTKVKTVLMALKLDSSFYGLTTGGGKNSSGQLAARINAVSEALRVAGL